MPFTFLTSDESNPDDINRIRMLKRLIRLKVSEFLDDPNNTVHPQSIVQLLNELITNIQSGPPRRITTEEKQLRLFLFNLTYQYDILTNIDQSQQYFFLYPNIIRDISESNKDVVQKLTSLFWPDMNG